MKNIIAIIVSLTCITTFGFEYKESSSAKQYIAYNGSQGIKEFILDYTFTNVDRKRDKLSSARKYKKSLIKQLVIVNEKYDRLVAKTEYNDGEKSIRELQKDITVQKQSTKILLAKTKKVSNYIQWLRNI